MKKENLQFEDLFEFPVRVQFTAYTANPESKDSRMTGCPYVESAAETTSIVHYLYINEDGSYGKLSIVFGDDAYGCCALSLLHINRVNELLLATWEGYSNICYGLVVAYTQARLDPDLASCLEVEEEKAICLNLNVSADGTPQDKVYKVEVWGLPGTDVADGAQWTFDLNTNVNDLSRLLKMKILSDVNPDGV